MNKEKRQIFYRQAVEDRKIWRFFDAKSICEQNKICYTDKQKTRRRTL
jgi:hypothetical protein